MKRTALIVLLLLLAACQNATPTPAPGPTPTPLPPPATPTPTPAPPLADGIVISEVMGGVAGNNNYEFIELYNAGAEIVDLQGWSLWYKLSEGDEERLVIRLKDRSLIPPQGHFLLGRADQDLDVLANASFEQALNLSKGGLELRRLDGEVVDRLGWGEAPADFSEGAPAPALENGLALERRPGGAGGNAIDSDDNAADFLLSDAPDPQNTGSEPAPFAGERLQLAVSAPETAQPGSEFSYTLELRNPTAQTLQGVAVHFPLPAGLELAETPPPGVTFDSGVILWQVDDLAAGAAQTQTLAVSAPWSQFTAVAQNYFASAADLPGITFGGPVPTRIEGGVIPIATARTMPGAEVTVEGVATMYTGGYFAGGGNTKFYLRDETGAIQVQVFGGEGSVNVAIGARVRVHGEIDVYRDALEIVPIAVPEDVEVLAPPDRENLPQPIPASIAQASIDLETLPGRLVEVQGVVTRVEEFTYSFEIDLMDDEGHVLALYVDKLTDMTVEGIAVGDLYRARGILEVRDGVIQLYPRQPSDLAQVFPPELRVVVEAPLTVLPGDTMTYTVRVFNHTDAPMTELRVTAMPPSEDAEVSAILDGGEADAEGSITWRLAELAGEGGSADLRYVVQVTNDNASRIISQGALADAAEWPNAAVTERAITFVGSTVPIWAVQGDGMASPHVQRWLAVDGVVTGVFPQLGGFFVQEQRPDASPLTADGIFVNSGNLAIDVAAGDEVEVYGQVRETAQQTQLLVVNEDDVGVLARGAALPEAVELDPPTATGVANVYYEGLEGMLVQVAGPAWAVSPTSQYGEYVVVLPKHGRRRLYQGEDNGIAIMVDDGSTAVHEDRSTLPYVVATGDEISALQGPLAYTFGRYKIEPLAPPQIKARPLTLPTLPLTRAGEFSLMTWNVENLFDTRQPHPSDPPLPTRAEYELALDKVANTLIAAGLPTIVALQEVENIGVLEDIAAHPGLSDYIYTPALIEGGDSRGIDVGYLVRGDRATLAGVEQYDAPEGLTSRPPLLVRVEVGTAEAPRQVVVLNNHFTSMSGGEEATEPRRMAQAAWNVRLIEDIIAPADPDAQIAVVGDLNSFYDAPPIDTLRQAGLQHVMETLPPEARYDYIFEGESEVLDHILVTPNLFATLKRVQILHVNADYPPPIPGDPSALRKSDHDPVVATFALVEGDE